MPDNEHCPDHAHDYRTALSGFDPDGAPRDVLEPRDYVLNEPTVISVVRERVHRQVDHRFTSELQVRARGTPGVAQRS